MPPVASPAALEREPATLWPRFRACAREMAAYLRQSQCVDWSHQAATRGGVSMGEAMVVFSWGSPIGLGVFFAGLGVLIWAGQFTAKRKQ
jgi:hypothetical protein